jgi:hypothetical protein
MLSELTWTRCWLWPLTVLVLAIVVYRTILEVL